MDALELLFFQVTDRRYAIPAHAVHAVSGAHAACDLPRLDLARLLGQRPGHPRMDIILHQSGQPVCALGVDQVLEVDSLPLAGLHPLPWPLHQAAAGVFGVYLPPDDPEHPVLVFDPAVLATNARRPRRRQGV